MKKIIHYGLTLSLICAMASASLAVMNSITKSKIIAQAKAEEEASLKEVMPLGRRFELVREGGNTGYYKAYDKDEDFIGIVFKAQAKGYSSTIETMSGLTKTGVICAIKVLSQNETPGLGARVAEPFFCGQFVNKNIRDLNGIQAITGATISSRAVIDSVKKKAEEILVLIKDEK